MGLFSGITDAIGLTDSGAADRAMDKASGLSKAQIERLDAIDLPDEEKMKLLLESPELVGLLEAEDLEDSKMNEIELDPALRENQMAALDSLRQQSEEGLTATDKYAMEQMLGDVDAQERSQRASIESDMARKGMDSSGAALMAKLQGTQSGANSARDKAMQMAAQGQQNRMAAIQSLGNLSGQMNQQDFAQQAQQASAHDAISRANAMNRQNVSGQNLAARQAIENQRSNIANQQQTFNKGLEQQQFDNKLKKTGAQNVVSQNQANMFQNQAGAQAGADASVMNTLGGLGAAYIGAKDGGIITNDNSYANGGVVQKENLPIQYQREVDMAEYKAAETKQHESFKKKYMKRIQDEVMGTADKPKTPVKPEGKTGHEGVHAEDGALFESSGNGEIVDSGMESHAGDRVDAKINDKEIVVNVPQQQRLMDLLRGKISVDELGTDDIVEGVPREFRDEMHEELEEESNPKVEGIQALLEMLGK